MKSLKGFKKPRPVKRKYISIHTKRSLLQKAENQCEHINPLTQQKCTSQFQLQFDHIKPLAKGGKDIPENLRVLCAEHNKIEAQKWGLKRPMK